VRNAVISAALTRARGVPSFSRRVRDPVGLVAAVFIALSGFLKSGRLSNGVVVDSFLDDVDGPDVDNDAIDCESNEEADDGVSIALLALLVVLLALELLAEVLTLLATLFIRPCASKLFNGQTSDNVTILTPIPSLLFAGIKSVVEPSFLFSEVRSG
jgi:hypothetical protein